MSVINIDYKNFINGESQSDLIADKGFSPATTQINLTKTRGMFYFNESPTDRGGATLTGNIIASCPDPAYSGNDRYYIDDEGAFYLIDSVTFTQKQAGAGSYTYQLGTTDLIPFRGNFYFTSQSTIGTFDNNMAIINEEWWSGLNNLYRHPMEVIEGELFIGNLNLIYYYDGTSTGTAFTLPTGVNVTSLRKHTDGRTLLAFTGSTADFSHIRNGQGKVYYCDPISRDWIREVDIEAQVEGTRSVGGIIYTTYGNIVGYFNGKGLEFLKKLDYSTTTYSQCMDNMEDVLLIRDGLYVKAFGNLGNGRVWWNCFYNETNSNHINNIAYKGDNKLLIAFQGASAGTGLLQEIDYDNAGVIGKFISNKIRFGQKVHIDKIEIVHDITNNAGTTQFEVHQKDLQGNINNAYGHSGLIATPTYVSQNVDETRIDCDIKESIFQLGIVPITDDIGFKEIRIYYEPIR